MASPDPAKLALNAATTRAQWSLAQAIEGCARHGIRGIAPWRDQLAAMGVTEAVRAIRAHGLTVTGLCRGGFFTAQDWKDDNRRAIEEAHALGARCLVLVVGGLPPGSKDLAGARERVREGIAAMARAGARIVVEDVFLGGAASQEPWRRALAGLDVLWVGVRCDAGVAAGREIARGDRTGGMAEAQARRVHEGVTYDLEVDTSRTESLECARLIAAHIG